MISDGVKELVRELWGERASERVIRDGVKERSERVSDCDQRWDERASERVISDGVKERSERVISDGVKELVREGSVMG